MVFIKKHKDLLLTILFITISFIIYGILCFHNNIWYDEAYQMILNRYNIKDIIYFVKNDTSPPLYALLLKLVTSIFGNELYVGRFLSLFIFNIQFILAFYPMKRLYNLKTSIIYSIMILLSFFSIFCSIEVRLYSLSMTSALGATLYSFLYLRDKKIKDLILYTLFAIVATYSHNYTTIAIFFLQITTSLISLIKKQGRKINIANIIIFITFLPWLKILFGQEKAINGNFWILKPTINTLIDSINKLLSFNNIVCIILLLIIVLAVFKTNKNTNKLLLLNIVPVFITIISFIIYSLIKNPLFVPKYLTPLCGVIYLIISALLGNTKLKHLFFIYLLLLIPNFINIYRSEIYNANDRITKEMINFINDNVKGEKVFFNISEDDLGISEYYFPNSTHLVKKDTNIIVRKPELFGNVTLNATDIDDKYIIVLYTSTNNNINRLKELKGKYTIINYYKDYCPYNNGYEIYILKLKESITS